MKGWLSLKTLQISWISLTIPESDLTSIPGVKDGYAKLIRDKRVYSSLEDMQKKLGAKRGLNWLRAYKQSKS